MGNHLRMKRKWLWVTILVVAVILAGLWALARFVPGLGGLNELSQFSAIASFVVAVAGLVVALWPPPASPEGKGKKSGNGDVIKFVSVKAGRSVKGKTGPSTFPGGDYIHMRGIEAGKDVIGKQTTQSRKERK